MKFVIAIAIALAAAGLAHLDPWHLRRRRPGRLIYPKYYLVLAVLCTTFFASVEIISLSGGWGATSQIAHFWFTGFAVVGLVVILGYFFEFYELSETGIRFQRLFRSNKTIAWADVTSLKFSKRYDQYDLESSHDVSFAVPPTMIGSEEFAAAALEYVPQAAIDEETRSALKEAANRSS